MQRPPQMMPVMPSFQPANITTEQIQKCLDENKKLILAILDNQNLGKLAECAQYQAQLQKNLMYLAAIADAQPQMPAMPAQVTTQMAPPPTMQQGGAGQFYMPHNPQAAAAAAAAMTAQQPGGIFPPRMPMQFASPQSQQFHEQQQQQQQLQQQHHQQAVQGQMNMRPSGPNNGMQSMMQGPEAALGGSSGVASQTKQQDTPRMGPGGGGDSGNGDGEGSFSRGAEENK